MKKLAAFFAPVFLATALTAHAGDGVPSTPKPNCESRRATLSEALLTNTKQALPLALYGILGAYSGANLNGGNHAIPQIGAQFHWFWSAGIFVFSTLGKLLEVESSRIGAVVGETAVNAGFTTIVAITGFYAGAPVALGFTAAFVASRILASGDRSPIEHMKPPAGCQQ